MRHAITAALILTCSASELSAQRGELTPELGLTLLVEVQSSVVNSANQLEPPLPAAGTVVGFRNDTVYVVTSNHHVENAAEIRVRLTPEGPLLPAIVRVVALELDIAVLAVMERAADPYWSVPTRVPRATGDFGLREPVYVIGCPEGTCWVPPERGVLSEKEDANLRVRTLYIKEGVSGGPLVDAHGALIGIVIRHGVGEGTAVRWDVIESEIRRLGYPVNLPEERGYRVGEFAFRIFGAAFPGTGRDIDGRRLFPGFRIEWGGRLAPGFEVVSGVNHVSVAARRLYEPNAGTEEVYAGTFFYAGLRASHPMTRWSLGRALPDLASIGADVLVPVSRSAYAVRVAATDSVDLVRGEYVMGRTAATVSVGTSLALRASYRVALTDRAGILVAPSLYFMNFDHLRGAPFAALFEIGADYR